MHSTPTENETGSAKVLVSPALSVMVSSSNSSTKFFSSPKLIVQFNETEPGPLFVKLTPMPGEAAKFTD